MKIELGKTITFFRDRDKYRIDLRHAIEKYGLSNLSKTILDTVPTDRKVLYEMPWYLNIKVFARIIQISRIQAQNTAYRRALNA